MLQNLYGATSGCRCKYKFVEHLKWEECLGNNSSLMDEVLTVIEHILAIHLPYKLKSWEFMQVSETYEAELRVKAGPGKL